MAETLIKSAVRSFKKGEIIFREGDIGEEMFIIRSGRVEVVKKIQDEELVLATLEANSFFGEMALFGDKRRTATIRAVENSEMITITKNVLAMQLAKAPDWFVAIMRTLVLRLKETNKMVKSRYYINLEYSLLKMLLWVITSQGKRDQGGLLAPLGTVLKEIQSTLGVSKEELMNKLKEFVFIKLIRFSEERNDIIIPDVERVKEFLLFIQGKKDKKTRVSHDFEKLQQDAVKMQYFERIYRLLARRKGEDAPVV
jgi:CRP-like cAMP-binding protein